MAQGEDPEFWSGRREAPAPSDEPYPSERQRVAEAPGAYEGDQVAPRLPSERTDVIPSRAPLPDRGPAPAPGSSRRRLRPTTRRVKRTLKHVDPIGILKISLFFYAIFLVLWLLFVAVLFNVLDGAGLFDAIKDFQVGFALEETDIGFWTVERWAFLIGLTFVVLASLLNVFLAFLFNVASDLFGGVEMTFVERDPEAPPR